MRRSLVFAMAAAAGCLGDPHVDCTTDAECRSAFGFGQVCGESGYCEAAELPARCISSYPTDLLDAPGDYTDAVVLASVYDDQYDRAEMQSARLAYIEADETGGIGGTDVALIECTYEENPAFDDLAYPDSIAAIGEFMAGRLGIAGFVGPYTSGQTEALYNATSDYGAFILSPAATSPSLTYIDGAVHSDDQPGLVWRTAPPDSLQGNVAAEDMIARGRTRVAVVYQTGAYGDGLSSIFTERFSQIGDVVGMQFTNTSELSADVAAVGADPTIEEVFFISSEASDIAAFMNGAGTLGSYDDDAADPYPATGRGIFLGDAAEDTDMLYALTADGLTLIDQVRGSAPSAPSNLIYDTFQVSYQSTFNQDPRATIYMPYAYDAGWLSLYAATWSISQEGGLSGVGMGSGMRRVSEGAAIELLPSGWNTGRAQFEAGNGIDVSGSSGELDYDPATEETATPVDVWVIAPDATGFEVVDTIYPS